ncbi:MAG TPA: GNAT family N-acetyltransferase [Permianibacter sp.]|nr:GNAT family N-acetyltransferase [Permianibacter sp.]
MTDALHIRDLHESEAEALGQLLVAVYSQLPGFPRSDEQPGYYEMLAAIGAFTKRPLTQVLVALHQNTLVGGVVYFGDMAQYGSGGTATSVPNAAGIRLLAVSPNARGLGVGKALTAACIARARQQQRVEVVLHTTKAMQVAWAMYEKLGFVRSPDLDFLQGELPVFGFRLRL